MRGGERRFIKRNSGYEGVSWNYNDIGALPGDRYHLVGFLASPDRILSDDLQLAVPSRPAPHELILLNGNIDSQRFYSLKTQQELLMSFGIGESNAVWSNIAQLSFYRENQAKGESNIFAKECMLQTYVDQGQGDVEMAEALRGLYTVRQNGTIDFSTDLLQQVKDEVPVAAVWFQALIDTGRIKNVRGFEDVTTVRQAVERVDRDNYKEFLVELRKDKNYLEDAVKEEDDKVTSIGVSVSEMYLVVPNTDLDRYLKVLARCKVQPRGIIAYDHLAVRLENFASKHKGDDKPLADVLRVAIPEGDGYIDYESQILGTSITPDKMAGYRKHVVGEKYLKDRKSLRKDEQGKLVVV